MADRLYTPPPLFSPLAIGILMQRWGRLAHRHGHSTARELATALADHSKRQFLAAPERYDGLDTDVMSCLWLRLSLAVQPIPSIIVPPWTGGSAVRVDGNRRYLKSPRAGDVMKYRLDRIPRFFRRYLPGIISKIGLYEPFAFADWTLNNFTSALSVGGDATPRGRYLRNWWRNSLTRELFPTEMGRDQIRKSLFRPAKKGGGKVRTGVWDTLEAAGFSVETVEDVETALWLDLKTLSFLPWNHVYHPGPFAVREISKRLKGKWSVDPVVRATGGGVCERVGVGSPHVDKERIRLIRDISESGSWSGLKSDGLGKLSFLSRLRDFLDATDRGDRETSSYIACRLVPGLLPHLAPDMPRISRSGFGASRKREARLLPLVAETLGIPLDEARRCLTAKKFGGQSSQAQAG
ncbi:MAG: hypothetical protein O7H41_19575 [Planctomycetota bacterium]|nr:hypothetical protein [Planctomycetota bacterium]